jgi:hypothetical protein
MQPFLGGGCPCWAAAKRAENAGCRILELIRANLQTLSLTLVQFAEVCVANPELVPELEADGILMCH